MCTDPSITELAPTAFRGRALGTNAFFIPLGQVVSSGVGAGMQNVRHGWRILFAIGVSTTNFAG